MTATVVIAVVAVLVVGWLAFLVASSIRNRGREEVPRNVAPGKTDDELESRRLEKVQAAAVVLTGSSPSTSPSTTSANRTGRPALSSSSTRSRSSAAPRWWPRSAAPTVMDPTGAAAVPTTSSKRSGINVNWAAPSLNDVFYRYNAEEVRYWIVYGRANTPCPPGEPRAAAHSIEQQVSDVINYLATQQIDQQAALAKIDPSVDLQLQRSTRPMPASPRPSPTRSSCSPTSRLRPIRRRWYSKPPPELPSWWRAEARASMPMATVSPTPPRPNWSRSWRTRGRR